MVENLQLRLKKPLHHVEVNLSEAKGYEKHVISELFKETYGKVINSSLPCSPENCQAIILYDAEKLSLESVLYIKWMVEKYKGCNKLFFCCSDESRLQPIQSHCTTVRLSSPSTQQIVKILEWIVEEEGIKLSRESIKKIILRSKNNLRQAIRSLEATYRHKNALNEDEFILTGWEDDILNIAKNIIREQSPRQLYAIRRKLQSLMIHDVPPEFIYKSLVDNLTSLVDGSLCSGVSNLHKEYTKGSEIEFESVKHHAQNKQGGSDERSTELTKKNAMNYLKVEEFIAKFMSWYKNSCKSDDHVQLIAGPGT
jgi:replication factor C subunit 3/5